MKKTKILIGVLALSLMLNIALIAAPRVYDDTPKGLYTSVAGFDGISIAVEEDGNYCIYRPNEKIIKKGKYRLKDDILFLDGSMSDHMYYRDGIIVYNLYDDTEDESMVVFERVDRMPGYAGIDHEEISE